MDKATLACHVVAMPFPGRGHVNPLLNFCKLIASTRTDIVIFFIVTEEWYSFLSSETLPENIRFATIPNVIPSEIDRGKDWPGFIRACLTKLEAPVEQLLDQLTQLPKPNVIIYDTYLKWVVGLGNRRNVPVASFWTQSATVYSFFHYFHLLVQNGHFNATLAEKGNEEVKYIPGVAPLRLADLPTPFFGKGQEVLPLCLEGVSLVSKGQYLLFTSTYEFEAEVIDSLRQSYSIPVYSIGPAIPYFSPSPCPGLDDEPEYFKWLNAQPKCSILYISQGSFLSASSAQLGEVIAGVHDSGVRFFWVTREDSSRYQKTGDSSKGLVVPWCDQLRVLCHSSLGGFWSHCGWNSTKEAIFSGLPVLSFPIFWDQQTNTKQIVEDWKFGWRVKRDDESLVTREEIVRLLQRFMDLESDDGKELRRRAKELQKICRKATEKGGSSSKDLEAFLQDISTQSP